MSSQVVVSEMGRTVRTYRTVLEELIAEWEAFRKALRKQDREAFDRLMEKARTHASAASYDARLDPSESLFMSILVELEHELEELREKLAELEKQKEEQEQEQ
jgi:DNA repair ATPase RecN